MGNTFLTQISAPSTLVFAGTDSMKPGPFCRHPQKCGPASALTTRAPPLPWAPSGGWP